MCNFTSIGALLGAPAFRRTPWVPAQSAPGEHVLHARPCAPCPLVSLQSRVTPPPPLPHSTNCNRPCVVQPFDLGSARKLVDGGSICRNDGSAARAPPALQLSAVPPLRRPPVTVALAMPSLSSLPPLGRRQSLSPACLSSAPWNRLWTAINSP